MDKTTILQEHLRFKKTSVHSVEKLKDIERYLGLFLNSNKKSLDKFTEDDIAKFLNSLTSKFSIRTINDIKTYVKLFVKWNYPDWSSRFRNLERLCKLQQPSRAYEPEQMLSIEEIEKLVEGEPDLMFKVYWVVFAFGGFRPSEACRLKWDNIFFEKEGVVIKIHTKKTNKDFYKSLPRNAEHLLKEWRTYNHSELLFPSPIRKDKPLTPRGIRGRLKRLSKRVLGKQVTPYQIRHSIATHLYNDDNRKDDDCANQLGHNKSMKQTYMNLNGEQLKARARMLWVKQKPLTPEERDELEKIKEQNKYFAHWIKIFTDRDLGKITQKEALLKMKALAKAIESR